MCNEHWFCGDLLHITCHSLLAYRNVQLPDKLSQATAASVNFWMGDRISMLIFGDSLLDET